MPAIRFQTTLSQIGSWTILHLPKNASSKLPSRGMVMVKGTINGAPFQTTLEPDGIGSHWFRIEKALLKAASARVGDTVTLLIESTNKWIEPITPPDLKKALFRVSHARNLWSEITPSARWDWIRWISATKNPETRNKRIDAACSMLTAGKRRPCCFDRAQCCEPAVSQGGILLGSAASSSLKTKKNRLK